jgi:hypothetical protein
VNIRNEQGLVPNEKLMFLWNQNTTHAHEEVNGEIYEKYFSEHTGIVILPPKSVIVADSGSYHRKKERLPT